jgi:tyrosine-protein kinase Etk/Wzc
MQSDSEDSFAFNKSQDSNLFTQMTQTYLPFWPIFMFTIGLGLMCSFFYLRYTASVYQVNAKLLLKDEKNGTGAAQILDAFNIFVDEKVVDNEIEIIHSSLLMKRVVRDLNLYTTQTFVGNVLSRELYGKHAPLQIIAANEDSVRGSGKMIPINVDLKRKRFSIQGKSYPMGSRIKLNGQDFFLLENPIFEATNDLPKPYPILLRTIAVEDVAAQLVASLHVETSTKKSTVFNVSMETIVPQKGKDVINQLFNVYDEFAIEDKNLATKNTLRFVERRLEIVSDELGQVEENIKNFKMREGIVNINEQGRLFLESVKENDQRLSDINIQLSVLKDLEQYVISKRQNDLIVPSLIGIDDYTLIQLLTKLHDAELQLARITKVTAGQSDLQVQLRNEISDLKPSILDNIGNIRTNLTTTQRKLNLKINQSNGILKKIPFKEKALVEISRQQSIKNTIYLFLLQKREELALSAVSTADSRVVEPAAYGSSPIKPNRMMIYLIGFSVGVILGIFYVLIRETANPAILFSKDIENRVNTPILVELARGKSNEHIVVKAWKSTILAEQFRMLRTNLAYSGLTEPKGNVIQVTSSVSGEGKSFVAENLAASIALTGHSVLIMELDLRKSTLRQHFGLESGMGVTDFLIEKVPLEQAIQAVPNTENLYLISSGAIPPNPTELLGSESFQNLMTQLKQRFDYIIMDTAPISLVTDSQVLAHHAKATLYVIRHNFTTKNFLYFIQQLFTSNKFNNLNLVFNGIKRRGINVFGKGYGYGYGYGYGNGFGYHPKISTSMRRTMMRKIYSIFKFKKN